MANQWISLVPSAVGLPKGRLVIPLSISLFLSLSLSIYICMSGMSLIQDVGIIEIMWWSLRIARCCITWGLGASSGVQQTTGIVVKSQLRCGPPRQSIQVTLFSYFVHIFMSRQMCWESHTHLFLSIYTHVYIYTYRYGRWTYFLTTLRCTGALQTYRAPQKHVLGIGNQKIWWDVPYMGTVFENVCFPLRAGKRTRPNYTIGFERLYSDCTYFHMRIRRHQHHRSM